MDSDKMITSNKRNVSIDLLKIVSMLMVVILHATGHGMTGAVIENGSIQKGIIIVLRAFSIVAVNCFVLITGYFMSLQEVRYKKILSLWTQVVTYSLVIYLILCVIPNSGVTFRLIRTVQYILPICSNQYWFVQKYILLLLVAPMLNILIQNLTKSQYEKMLITLFVVFSAIPTINIYGDTFGVNSGYSLCWFIILYLMAGYIRKFPITKLPYMSIYVIISIGVSCILMISDCMVEKDLAHNVIFNSFEKYNSVTTVLASLSLFCGTITSKIRKR